MKDINYYKKRAEDADRYWEENQKLKKEQESNEQINSIMLIIFFIVGLVVFSLIDYHQSKEENITKIEQCHE